MGRCPAASFGRVLGGGERGARLLRQHHLLHSAGRFGRVAADFGRRQPTSAGCWTKTRGGLASFVDSTLWVTVRQPASAGGQLMACWDYSLPNAAHLHRHNTQSINHSSYRLGHGTVRDANAFGCHLASLCSAALIPPSPLTSVHHPVTPSNCDPHLPSSSLVVTPTSFEPGFKGSPLQPCWTASNFLRP